jgi:hypothetical protein
MGGSRQAAESKAEFLREAEAMYERLQAWRKQHLEASFDEIAEQVTPQRRALMGVLLKQLAEEVESRLDAPECESCGREMVYKGRVRRGVVHSEGESGVERAYYHCPDCASGLFPPGPSPQTESACVESADDSPSGAPGDRDRFV